MNHSFFEKNLQCLESRYPDYADILRATPAADSVELIQPDEVHDWLHQAVSLPVEQVVLLGTRGGYAIDTLLREYNLRNLVVIEKEFTRFRQVLANLDLTRALLDPQVYWVVGCPVEDLEEGLEYCKTSLAAVGFQILQDPHSWREYSPYYISVMKELRRIIDDETFSLRARLARGQVVQRNLISNLPVMMRSNVLDDVQNRFANVPAVVVAAGPSLDKNVHELLRLNDSALIVAVDTALRTLNQHGIRPHMVVTSDPTQENAAHFEGVEWPEGSVFAYSPDCYYSLPRQFETVTPKICLYDDSARITYHLKALLPFRCVMPRAMHVGESAIRLALILGCDPIIFTGLDLALPPAHDRTHARNSARAGRILSRSEDNIQVELANGKTVTHSLMTVPGIDGGTVQTFYAFSKYLEQLEDLIEYYPTPVRWIDATEGGARKKGCEVLPLREVADRLQDRSYGIARRLSEIPAPPTASYRQTCVPIFRVGMQHLRMMAELLELIPAGVVDEAEAERIWNHFISDEETRSLLDHAVFQFQIYSRVHQLPPERRWDFMKTRAQQAADIIRLFLPIWEEAVERMGED